METFQKAQYFGGFDRLRCSESICGLTTPAAKGALIRALPPTVRTVSSTQNCVVVNPAPGVHEIGEEQNNRQMQPHHAEHRRMRGMYVGRTRKKFSGCTLETLFAKREVGYTRHHIFYIQSVEKEVHFLGPRPRKARCVASGKIS